jgi:hypothetical protein
VQYRTHTKGITMTTRIAVSETVAAYSLFANGYNSEQVHAFILSQRGTCTHGYIYADAIPTILDLKP